MSSCFLSPLQTTDPVCRYEQKAMPETQRPVERTRNEPSPANSRDCLVRHFIILAYFVLFFFVFAMDGMGECGAIAWGVILEFSVLELVLWSSGKLHIGWEIPWVIRRCVVLKLWLYVGISWGGEESIGNHTRSPAE